MAAGVDVSGRRGKFVAALAEGVQLAEAARRAGCSVRTAQRWRRDPLVLSALRQAQDSQLSDVVRRMNHGSALALDVLSTLMNDRKCPASVRLRAAATWLDMAFKARELLDLVERISRLEEAFTNEKR